MKLICDCGNIGEYNSKYSEFDGFYGEHIVDVGTCYTEDEGEWEDYYNSGIALKCSECGKIITIKP